MGTLFDVDEMTRSAEMSPCGRYRYKLARAWSPNAMVNFVMLNPSTADDEADDPTIRRCIGFANRWGYGGIVVTNLFAFRATDPKAMKSATDPIGPENDRAIRECATAAGVILCAWGTDGGFRGRDKAVLAIFRGQGWAAHALRLSKDGHPCHPLYLPTGLRPFVMGG